MRRIDQNMHRYEARIVWERGDAPFTGGKYSRAHNWIFDGGNVVRGSASPRSVPAPYSEAFAVDPEEALVAAASSCHMLMFLYLAAKQEFIVSRYEDHAVGEMKEVEPNRFAITRIFISPKIEFEGNAPTFEQLQLLHREAHHDCYIANSLRADIILI